MFWKISLFALALVSLSAPLSATVIYVSGDQTGTWSADTVIVTAEVRVPPGQSLTISPCVEVLFSVYCKLIVDSAATLRAIGTPADSIRFDVLPPNGNWHGIRFLSASDNSGLEYCHLAHGSAEGTIVESLGGAIYCSNTDLSIHNTSISQNYAAKGGGIYFGNNSHAEISSSTITLNHSEISGGGIECQSSDLIVSGNLIAGNSTWLRGGGICCSGSNLYIGNNVIVGNSAVAGSDYDCYGGGIYLGWGTNSTAINNTIFGNSAIDEMGGGTGGGIYGLAEVIIRNCILWDNLPTQIVPIDLPTTYSDVMWGIPGTGNINLWPAFVDTAQDDYRLHWGSPCIDTGDPNPVYNDPDGSRADMGAWYYDQSLPVRILLTPYNQPIQIPSSGGSFQYAIQSTNIESMTLSVLVWCNATLPSGAGTAPLLGPVTISLASGQTLSRVRTQTVPAGAPAGMYHYNAYAVAAGDTSTDSFMFVKLGDSGQAGMTPSGGWTNTGEALDMPLPEQAARPRAID